MRLFNRAALLAAAVASVSSAACADDGFKLSEKLSVSGFIDMSYVYVDTDNAPKNKQAGVDQAEIDFKYDFNKKMTAQVDLEAQRDATRTADGDYTTNIEQAFFNYKITDEFSVKGGRFLSYSGWETEEPTGLFQQSGAGYGPLFYGYYQDGLSAMYSNGLIDVGLSVVDDAFGGGNNPALGSGNMNDMGYEVMLGVHPTKDWTVKAFYLSQDYPAYKETKYNIWTSYVINGFTLAAEYSNGEDLGVTPIVPALSGPGYDGSGYLFMVNYAWTKVGLTFRYHGFEADKAGIDVIDRTAFTLSPSYKVNSNLLLVAEARFDENKIPLAPDSKTYALEALVTF